MTCKTCAHWEKPDGSMNPREVAIRICLALMPNAVITVNGVSVDPFDYIESKETITFQSITT